MSKVKLHHPVHTAHVKLVEAAKVAEWVAAGWVRPERRRAPKSVALAKTEKPAPVTEPSPEK